MKLTITTQSLLAAFTLSQVLASAAGAIPPPTVAPSTVAAPTVASPTVATPASSTVPTTVPPAQSSAATFRCVQAGSGHATVVSRGAKQATLITWNSTSFGPEFSPQTRCNTVSQKFQTTVDRNGGKLSNLVLTIGTIGSQTVVCAINQGHYGCNRENMLFTLNQENAKNSGAVLANLLQIGKYGKGNAVSETTELPEFNLEEVVNQKLSDTPQAAPPEQPSVTSTEAPATSNDSSGSVF